MRVKTRIRCMDRGCGQALTMTEASGPTFYYECGTCGQKSVEVQGIDGVHRWRVLSEPHTVLPAEGPSFSLTDPGT